MEQDDEDAEILDDEPTQHDLGPSVLPKPVANAISLVTRSSSMYLRLGTFIGSLALDGARITTLTGLELSRAVIEGVLTRAGRDVTSRSLGELGKQDSEGLLERSIATLHATITHISFAASAGFHISSTALASAGDLSQHLLAALDQILGSTDSSRAIASIVLLVRREFENPATGQPGEKVGLVDLLVGVCGLALLQRWCKRLDDSELKSKGVEDVVWDVVILDDGRRADIATTDDDGTLVSAILHNKGQLEGQTSFMTTSGTKETLYTIQTEDQLMGPDAEAEWLETTLKKKIMQSLPANAHVSIKTEVSTTRTITVEVTGDELVNISPPSGIEIVEEDPHPDQESRVANDDAASSAPKHRVVYRTIRNRSRETNVVPESIERGLQEDGEKQALAPAHDSDLMVESLQQISSEETETKATASFTLSPLSSPEPEEQEIDQYTQDLTAIVHQDTFPTALQTANQKRQRKPISISSVSGSETPPTDKDKARPSQSKKIKPEASEAKAKGTIRNALRKGSGTTLSSLWNKEQSTPVEKIPALKSSQVRQPWGGTRNAVPTKSKYMALNKPGTGSQLPIPSRVTSTLNSKTNNSSKTVRPAFNAPRPPQRGNPNYFSSRDLGEMTPQSPQRSASRASYYEIHERRRDSVVSQTDTYSVHSNDTRPGSPTTFRTHLRAQSDLMRTKSEKNVSLNTSSSPGKHRRAKSNVPSIYTLNTNTSETSLILAPHLNKSAYDNEEALRTLVRTGHIDGLFPQHHIVRNITRFVRFASASYGSHFMRVMGIASTPESKTLGIDQDHHYEHHSFSHHTQLPPSTILLSSFVDPQGGTDSTGQTNTGVPMVHFVSLDHESEAVVLTCRGTLGFEDVLTDMTCDYDDLILHGKAYKVHKGIHASAVRLLSGNGSRVIATLAAALEEFPTYGLVMCGHSLGGGVVSLLAIMISEPSTSNYSFITTSSPYQPTSRYLLGSSSSHTTTAPTPIIRLPSNRPIHVYAYGPPSTLSPSLRLATRGLITTIINGQDTVPYLSLGVLHDLQAIALAFKTDDKGAKGEFRARVWAGLTSGFADKWYGNRAAAANSEEDDEWAYAALKTLRASMLSQKLVPPGECFIVETMPVLQRDAFVRNSGDNGGMGGLGRPATRAVLKYVRDVEKRFGELRFGGGMLLDHSPGRYEASLKALGKGVLG